MHPSTQDTRRTELLEAVSFSATAFLRARHWRDVVDPVLEALGRSMGVTRVHLFRTIEINGDVIRSRQAHEWVAGPEWSERDSPELRDFELSTFALSGGPEPLQGDRVIALRTADFDEPARSRWRARGIVSSLAVALFAGGERWGALGVDECLQDRPWTPEERNALLAVADVFGAAIERQRAEQALRESEARLSLALESSVQGLWDWHIPSGRVHFDPLWSGMLGYEPEEIEPRIEQWEALLHPDDAAPVKEVLRRHLAGELSQYLTEHRLRHADGSWRWILDQGRVVERDAEGRASRMVGTHMDITERKNAERLQQEQAEALRLLYRAVEQSPASIVVTDRTGSIVYVNSRFTQITGYSAAEALGANPRLLQSGSHPPGFYRDLWDTITAARDWRGEICNRRKDGALLWEHMSISPVVDVTGTITHFVAVKEDITARRALEEQLRHSQKLDAFGQLAGGVAHDFNNMLTVISGFAALLEPEVKDGEGQAYLAEVQHAARRSAELTQQLLALSRKQILNPVLVDLNRLVMRFQLMLKRVLGEDVLLVTRVCPRPLMVRADPGQLEQVLLNLAVNARDAMPNGGQLTITTTERPDPGTHTTTAEVTVADTGTGIPAAHIDRIFEPFFTTKPVGRGTGLGLSTVYGIVTQSGGTVTVESPPGAGTCFRVLLPLVASVETPSQVQPSATTPRAVGSGTIMVVEDEDAVRSLAVAILERAGYRAFYAKDGAAALALLEGLEERVDLVLADVVMPGMGGRELSTILQQRFPGLPVLFMSGHTDDHVLRHGVEQQAVAFISKPFSPDTLLARVHGVLARSA